MKNHLHGNLPVMCPIFSECAMSLPSARTREARAASVARAVIVPDHREHVVMIFHAIEAEPVPSVGWGVAG